MAMYSASYHGLMRISETTEGEHNIKAKDVAYALNKSKLTLYLRSSKMHTTADNPQVIIIKKQPTWRDLCPVKLIENYANLRGRTSDYEMQPFFKHQNDTAISQQQFRTNLKYILFSLGLPAELYSSHSFRIGKATDEKLSGKSIAKIKDDSYR